MPEKIYNNKIVAKVRNFIDGSLFPIFVGAFILLFYFLRLHIVALAVLAFLVSLILLFCKDIRPAIPEVVLSHLVLCHYYGEIGVGSYLKTSSIVVYCVFGAMVLGSLAFNLIAYRKGRKLQKSKIGTGLLCMCCAFLFGGIFSKYYAINNFLTGLVFTGAYFVVYAVFFVAMEHRADNLRYVAIVCCVSASVVICQIAHIYAVKYTAGMALDNDWKSLIVAGWGISNTLGEFLAMFFPAVFYLIYKEKRGYLYYILLVLMAIALFFTLCRAGILFGGGAFVVCSVIVCLKGENKKINRIITAVLGAMCIAVAVVGITPGLLDKVFAFFSDTGMNDRGRFPIWKEWLRLFKEEPILGVGFRAYRIVHPLAFAINAHNTPIQMLAGTGIMGFMLYLFHRVETVKLFTKKPNLERMFLGGVALVGVLCSLLDPLFFRAYFAMYYSVCLLAVEKSLTHDEQEDKENSEQNEITDEDKK